MTSTDDLKRRTVRSFVRREGRITKKQSLALEMGASSHCVKCTENTNTFPQAVALFTKEQPLILEIGFGMGQSLLQMAHEHPAYNYIGVEVHRPGIGALLTQILSQNITNLKIIEGDAVSILGSIPEKALYGVQIFFPDPWPKKRHHKRRLIQGPFITQLATKIQPGGFVHLATDWEDYARQMMAVMSADAQLANVYGPGVFTPNSQGRGETKFEQRGLRLGHKIWDLYFIRPPHSDVIEDERLA